MMGGSDDVFKFDGFVKSPTSALRFISLSLRRTLSTPHDTKFTRLEFEAFYFAIPILTFYDIIKIRLLFHPVFYCSNPTSPFDFNFYVVG